MYERPEDLAREKAVMDIIAAEYFDGAPAEKMDQHSGADFLVTERNGAESIVEIKTRTAKVGQYKTYIIARQKYDKMLKLQNRYDYAFLAIRWTDAIGIVQLPLLCEYKVIQGGRRDRNDKADIEEMIEFPISEFEIISEF